MDNILTRAAESESESVVNLAGIGVGVDEILPTLTPARMCWRQYGLLILHFDFYIAPAPMAIR